MTDTIDGTPYTLDEFADLCQAHDLAPLAGSGRWVRYPAAGVRWVLVVRVEKKRQIKCS
jgi:hypothetical protein